MPEETIVLGSKLSYYSLIEKLFFEEIKLLMAVKPKDVKIEITATPYNEELKHELKKLKAGNFHFVSPRIELFYQRRGVFVSLWNLSFWDKDSVNHRFEIRALVDPKIGFHLEVNYETEFDDEEAEILIFEDYTDMVDMQKIISNLTKFSNKIKSKEQVIA